MKDKNKIITNPVIVAVFAVVCCFLWGSAFPCIKIGYSAFGISGAPSVILFAGMRFFFAGILVIIAGSIINKKFLYPRISSLKYVGRVVSFSDDNTISVFLPRAYELFGSKEFPYKFHGSIFCHSRSMFYFQNGKIYVQKISGLHYRIRGDNNHKSRRARRGNELYGRGIYFNFRSFLRVFVLSYKKIFF